MSIFHTVLYPTDFSACAEAARPLAFELARHADALHLLYVDSLFGSVHHGANVRQRLADLGEEAPVPIETVLTRDIAPAAAILRYAESHDVGLIAMGTHGRRGLSRLLLGSTAREVVQLAPCPVLTVRPGTDDAALPALHGGAILVAVDFSDTADEALRQALRLADAFDAHVDLLHVVEEPFRPVGGGYTLQPVYQVEPGLVRSLGDSLRELYTEAGGEPERLGTVEVVPGFPSRVIGETAERLRSGLIVLGTKGLRGFEHLVMGSIAEAVVRTAPCPVLTVKTPAARTAARAAVQAGRETSGTEPDTEPGDEAPGLRSLLAL
ncbi:MAG: universal stress protein [Rhodothermales bacterium]